MLGFERRFRAGLTVWMEIRRALCGLSLREANNMQPRPNASTQTTVSEDKGRRGMLQSSHEGTPCQRRKRHCQIRFHYWQSWKHAELSVAQGNRRVDIGTIESHDTVRI
jgi:hypothetical protein